MERDRREGGGEDWADGMPYRVGEGQPSGVSAIRFDAGLHAVALERFAIIAVCMHDRCLFTASITLTHHQCNQHTQSPRVGSIHIVTMYCGVTYIWPSVHCHRIVTWSRCMRARYEDPHLERPRPTLCEYVQRQLLADEAQPCRPLLCYIHPSTAWLASHVGVANR